MKYIFKADISADEFNSFVKTYSFAPITQTESWGKLKIDWEKRFCGIFDEDGKMCGGGALLIRNLAPMFKLAYCPRGPVFDLSNPEVFDVFMDGIRQFAKKNGIYSVKIDPPVPLKITPPEMEESEYFTPFDSEKDERAKNYIFSAGFSHKGFSLVLNDYIQPRFNMIVPLAKKDGISLNAAELKKHFKSSERKYMGAFVINRGMFFEEAELSDENTELFASIMKSTEERQGIFLRNKEYFKRLLTSFGEKAKLYFIKTDVDVYIKYLTDRMASESDDDKAKTSELLAEAEKVKAERGRIIPLSGSIVIMPPNETGVRMAEYLYAGSDLSSFCQFSAADVMLAEIMKSLASQNVQLLNLGGVEGTLDDGLYAFKSKFNPILAEYIGEFDLVINKFKYNIVEKNLPWAARLYRRFVSLIKKEK